MSRLTAPPYGWASVRNGGAFLLSLVAGLAVFAPRAAQAADGPPAVNPFKQLKQRYNETQQGSERIGVRTRYAFVANDPLVGSQWHLDNGLGWSDVNIQGAWSRGYTGAGVTIGIVDDGLQHLHPDLAPNYSPTDSFDFGPIINDLDPSPFYNNSGAGAGDGDNHGTAVAGVAAARGGNGTGGSGAAPLAKVAGLRADFTNFFNPNQFADATRYRSSGAVTTIDVKNHSYGISDPYVPTNAELAALNDSSAAGTIHVFAAGNERQGHNFSADGDANKKAEQNSINSIAVGALAFNGTFASYSNWGANLFVTAPTSGAGLGITTTDRTGSGLAGGYNDTAGSGIDFDPLADLDYTSVFGGTSSAAPLVSGVLALAKEANPALDTRMAKHLLVLTSDSTIDSSDATLESDGGWQTNAAGNRFNQNYGFGLIDAEALTAAATLYAGVTAPVFESVVGGVNAALPDAIVNDLTPGVVTRTFNLFQPGALEEMVIGLNISHTYTGDLQATLTSPAGTSSRLMLRNIADPVDNLSWAFTSNAFWGENPVGAWTLSVEDWFTGDIGIWQSFSATAITGSLILVPEPATLAIVLAALVVGSRQRSAGR
ncbi:S8 family serine peptidase [Botrimarina hoheduenensis]|uniref:Calcium-dependent protease n=1 Tax=Botrimarina hoheduenensis TaxID=2528000 RepID=A0A5C5VZW8_9BACT|nr:S8 family serine peptidase [Botrimarina hoheduenensis]TWT43349.1 Calcium-dependent protease precursor [Botrimarina hoheduenensis]